MGCVAVKELAGGQYVYRGFLSGLERYVKNNTDAEVDTLNININVDGIPLYKSSGKQLWPILASVNNTSPFAVAHWLGGSKPNNVNDFLKDFVDEIKDLTSHHYIHKGLRYKVKLQTFICDAPARAFLKCTVGHTGYSACERCECYGQHIGSVRLLDTEAPLRTDEKFAEHVYTDHQVHGVSPLVTYLGVSMVSGFALDYMHLVCLGVVRRLIAYWRKGPGVKLSRANIDAISSCQNSLRNHVPSVFQRRPRSLEEADYWKATEFRFFLLYGGMIVLKDNISEDRYQHFMFLSLAMRILLSKAAIQDEYQVEYAKGLLKLFIKGAIALYGPDFITYNVHSLLHLADDVKHYSVPLDSLSAFPFESYLGKLKSLVHSAVCPLQQVVKRLDEIEQHPDACTIRPKNFQVTNKIRDRVFYMEGEFFVIVHEVLQNGNAMCEVIKKERSTKYFDFPTSSTNFNIHYIASISHTNLTEIPLRHLKQPAMMLPIENDEGGFVLLPMVHIEHQGN